jgi:hypothetical protein
MVSTSPLLFALLAGDASSAQPPPPPAPPPQAAQGTTAPSSTPPDASPPAPAAPTVDGSVATASEPSAKEGDDANEREPSLAELFETGIQWSVSPGVLFPTNGGDAAFVLGAHVGYGVRTGPVILRPGVDGDFLFPAVSTVIAGAPSFRVTYPIGRFAPFIRGAAGFGSTTATGTLGAALKAGGGFTFYASTKFFFGVGAEYFTITDTRFQTVNIGPFLGFGI